LLSALLAPPIRDSGRYATVALYRLDSTGPAYMSVTNCEKIVRSGSEKLRRINVIRYLQISAEAADILEQHQKNKVDSDADLYLPPPELRSAFTKLQLKEFDSALTAASPFLTSTDPELFRGASFIASTALAEV
jgi:hypothetical protein